MDLRQVQEELRKDILDHQTLMEQLKQHPTDHALNVKLKDIQQHIADLGSKQKKILESRNLVQSGPCRSLSTEGSTVLPLQPAISSRAFPVPQLQVKDMKTSQSSRPSDTKSSYTLITIKSPTSSTNLTHLVTAAPTNSIAMNLTNQVASNSGTTFVSSPALLVVSSSNQMSSNKHHVIGSSQASKPTSIPISLASLASKGGVVTLAGAWQSSQNQSPTHNAKEMGRLVQKQVQIKLPVVQSHGSKPMILMPQKNQTVNSKSLFRLLPKGQHSLTMNGPTSIASGISAQAVIPSPAIKSSNVPQKQLSAILMTGDGCKNTPTLQRLFVQRPDQRTKNQNIPTSWQDLSSQTPTIRKPSYVPRKSFPNINNGVGSFQKFRILDGKTETLRDKPNVNHPQSASSSVMQEKPKNAALKAVLTSAPVPTSGMMTVARLVSLPVSRNGFIPIQQQTTTLTSKAPVKPVATIPNVASNASAAPVPVASPTVSVKSVSSRSNYSNSPDLDNQAKEKLTYLRNIELIPKEQAEKVRGRRFRKRRVAANPVYSGGMYVTNEIEPKRQCPDILASAAESITAPDVIVKRPRGRPRGSKNSNTLTMKLQSSIRSNHSNSPADQSSVQYVQRLKTILNSVASNKPSNPTPQIKPQPMEQSYAQSENKGNTQTNAVLVKLKSGSTSSERSESPEGSDEHEDQCAICGRTGEVLMCDTCSRVYHLSCATPPLDTVPQGMWVCSECKKEFKESKSKVEWPGIAAVVHAFSDFDKVRDKEIVACQKKLTEYRRIVTSQQVQMKALTAVVTTKVNHRMNASKERQITQKGVNEMAAMAKRCFTLANILSEKTLQQQSG